eukprot:CAMPEP_0117426010 /NCGR_PEP_ID=MMETSP0758-20121206/6195_1 /TAXON_ID=63605 /ORGANISM="Percolomonas cosmopolitus, Strain AE-1 (ATCC 50343)" /LENGTH=195 /DNA_ID=CAMNT_0005210893 /DNA_START=99 /DNA_END=682 /DNA_ORIENTATION=-
MKRFLEDTFSNEQTPTIGVEFGSKVIEIGDYRVKLQLWDTAGQEQYQSVTRSYYRAAAGALLVYDLSSMSSFKAIPHWLKEARELGGANIQCTLVGNKSDKSSHREVPFMVASEYAQEHDLTFFETSALENDDMDDIFASLARRILRKMEENMMTEEQQLIKNRVHLLKDSNLSDSTTGGCCGFGGTVTDTPNSA